MSFVMSFAMCIPFEDFINVRSLSPSLVLISAPGFVSEWRSECVGMLFSEGTTSMERVRLQNFNHFNIVITFSVLSYSPSTSPLPSLTLHSTEDPFYSLKNDVGFKIDVWLLVKILTKRYNGISFLFLCRSHFCCRGISIHFVLAGGADSLHSLVLTGLAGVVMMFSMNVDERRTSWYSKEICLVNIC